MCHNASLSLLLCQVRVLSQSHSVTAGPDSTAESSMQSREEAIDVISGRSANSMLSLMRIGGKKVVPPSWLVLSRISD